MANTVDAPRLAAVARMIRRRRGGATLEEIVEAAKEGLVSEDEAVRALEQQFEVACRNRWRREVPCGIAVEYEVDPEAHLERDAMVSEVRNVLLRVLNDLPPRQRQVLELFYFDGLGVQAIADRLSLKQPTVSEHLGLAVHSIAQYAEKDPMEVPPNGTTSEGYYFPRLMRMEWRKWKKSTKPFYPYQLWHKYNVEGYWARNGIYATRYENRLRQYLKDAFGDIDIKIPNGV